MWHKQRATKCLRIHVLVQQANKEANDDEFNLAL